MPGPILRFPDQFDQLAHRRRSSVEVRKAPEQVDPRQLDAVGGADEADVPARAGGMDRLHHRLLRADGLDDGVRPDRP